MDELGLGNLLTPPPAVERAEEVDVGQARFGLAADIWCRGLRDQSRSLHTRRRRLARLLATIHQLPHTLWLGGLPCALPVAVQLGQLPYALCLGGQRLHTTLCAPVLRNRKAPCNRKACGGRAHGRAAHVAFAVRPVRLQNAYHMLAFQLAHCVAGRHLDVIQDDLRTGARGQLHVAYVALARAGVVAVDEDEVA